MYRFKAYQLKQVDKERDLHRQAWLNQRVTATDKKGTPVFVEFKDFFDYEKWLGEVEGKKEPKVTEQQKRMAQAALMVNK